MYNQLLYMYINIYTYMHPHWKPLWSWPGYRLECKVCDNIYLISAGLTTAYIVI